MRYNNRYRIGEGLPDVKRKSGIALKKKSLNSKDSGRISDILLLILLLIAISSISSVSAATRIIPQSSEPATPIQPFILFEGFSQTAPGIEWNASITGIPDSILRYDVISLDSGQLINQISAGQPVHVVLNGVRYTLILRQERPDYFVGHLESIPEKEIQDYIVRIWIVGDEISASMNGNYLKRMPNQATAQSGTSLYYIYSEADIRRTPVDPEIIPFIQTPKTPASSLICEFMLIVLSVMIIIAIKKM
jgi:hypothetical protein